jgi:hypothetical protein
MPLGLAMVYTIKVSLVRLFNSRNQHFENLVAVVFNQQSFSAAFDFNNLLTQIHIYTSVISTLFIFLSPQT